MFTHAFLFLIQYVSQEVDASILFQAPHLRRLSNSTAVTLSGSTATENLSPDALATSCNAEKLSWIAETGFSLISVSTRYDTEVDSQSFGTWETETSTVLSDPKAQPTTLCDGYPRINGTTTLTSSRVITTTIYSTNTFTRTSRIVQSVPTPTCTITNPQCSSMEAAYSSSLSEYQSSASEWYKTSSNLETDFPGPSPTSVICGVPHTTVWRSTLGPPVCFANTLAVRLLYWPVTSVSGGLCDGTRLTLTESSFDATGPRTLIYKTTTLTSPTVYLEIAALATFNNGSNAATPIGNIIAPFAPESVSSRCAEPSAQFGMPQRVDFADFNNPVPASAYRCQPKCFTGLASENLCSTIYNDFNPALAIPNQLFARFDSLAVSLSPYETCLFGGGNGANLSSVAVLYDPPTALHAVTTLFTGHTSSTMSSVSITPASPSASIKPSTPTPTSPPLTGTMDPWEHPTSTVSPTKDNSSPGSSASSVSQSIESSQILPDPTSSIFTDDPGSRSSSMGHSIASESQASETATIISSQSLGGIIASIFGFSSSARGSAFPVSATATGDPVDSTSFAEVSSGPSDASSLGSDLPPTTRTFAYDPSSTAGSTHSTLSVSGLDSLSVVESSSISEMVNTFSTETNDPLLSTQKPTAGQADSTLLMPSYQTSVAGDPSMSAPLQQSSTSSNTANSPGFIGPSAGIKNAAVAASVVGYSLAVGVALVHIILTA